MFMLRRMMYFCLTGFFAVSALTLRAHTPDSLRLEAIITQTQEASLPHDRKKLLRLLKSATRDSARFNALWNLCEKLLTHDTPNALHDSLNLTCLRFGLQSGRLSAAGGQRGLLLLQQIASGQPGHPAVDFPFTARDGKRLNLSEISSGKTTLLVFFDPFCRQCQEFIGHIGNDKRFTDMVKRQTLSITAVNVDADRPMWERIKNDLPTGWLVGQTFSDSVFNNYDLRSFPSVYLLGKDRRVILHSKDIELIYKTLYDLIPKK